MARHRAHSIALKRQVVQEYLAGETLHGLARRHELSHTLTRPGSRRSNAWSASRPWSSRFQ